MPQEDDRRITWSRYYPVILTGIIVAGVLLRLAPISQNRFHEDEALYGYWGLQIATGADPMLNDYPVDKPPLFSYLLSLLFGVFGASEAVARLPSLTASAISMLVVAWIAGRVYGRDVALVSVAVLAFSPFDISFATTVFTDPPLVLFVLVALAAIIAGRPWLAGLSLGLAFDTKQQAISFIPLIIAAGAIFRDRMNFLPVPEPAGRRFGARVWWSLRRAWSVAWVRGIVGFLLAITPAIWWDLARTQRPGFLEQSLISYGGLRIAAWSELGARASEWLDVIGMFSGSMALNLLLLGGMIVLLGLDVRDLRRQRSNVARRRAWFDLLLAGFSLLLLFGHWIIHFNVWDRYLLGLVPLLAMLAGRALLLPARLLADRGGEGSRVELRHALNAGLAMALLVAMVALPAGEAAQGKYPAGGDHGVYQGIDEVAAYVGAHVPGNAIIHHRWLGWHYLYYMYDYPHAFRWYQSPEELIDHAGEWPEVPQWIVFPEWQEHLEMERALTAAGLSLHERYSTLRPDGTISFRIFEIVPLINRCWSRQGFLT